MIKLWLDKDYKSAGGNCYGTTTDNKCWSFMFESVDDIPECHKVAVALLDAATSESSEAQIGGVGRKRLLGDGTVVYDLDKDGRKEIELC